MRPILGHSRALFKARGAKSDSSDAWRDAQATSAVAKRRIPAFHAFVGGARRRLARGDVALEGRHVHGAGRPIGASPQQAVAFAPIDEEIVDRDPVSPLRGHLVPFDARGMGDDSMPPGASRVPLVFEAARDGQEPGTDRGGRRAPLLLEEPQELGAGDRHRDQRVAEGLRRMEIAEGDGVMIFPAPRKGRAQAAGIDEGHLGAGPAHRLELGIGHELAQAALARGIRKGSELAVDDADFSPRVGRRPGDDAFDVALHGAVGREAARVDRHQARLGPRDASRHAVEREVDRRDHPAVRRSAGHEAPADAAGIRLVRVAAHDEIDRRIQPPDDLDDRPLETGASGIVVPAGQVPALVDEEDDRLDPRVA